MKRKIYLDGKRYVPCDVRTSEKIDVYEFDNKDYKKVFDAMMSNGYYVVSVDDNLINIIEMAEKNTMLFIKTNKICFCGAILNQKKWGTLYICPKCQARYEVNVTNK